MRDELLRGEQADKANQPSNLPQDPGGGLTKKDGDKKSSMNQNLTVAFVCFMTESVMIEANRCGEQDASVSLREGHPPGFTKRTSYRSPEATVNMLISACFFGGVAGVPETREDHLLDSLTDVSDKSTSQIKEERTSS
jgi:hypothetical protein